MKALSFDLDWIDKELSFVRIAMAQINTTLSDFKYNSKRILEDCHKAIEFGADLIIFPECALFGYPPMDLLERDSLVQKQNKALEKLVKKLPSQIDVLLGAVTNNKKSGKKYLNSAVLISKNKIAKIFSKELLPTYDVFDEHRHFEFSQIKNNIIKYKNKSILVLICEDIWAWKDLNPFQHEKNPLLDLNKKIDLSIVLNASPYSLNKSHIRKQVAKKVTQKLKAPLLYINMCGAQDELIFDGGSFALNSKGKVTSQSLFFQEDLKFINLKKIDRKFTTPPALEPNEELRQALVLGLKDFVNKIGLQKVHFGLSGGIDSALVACLAVDALGPNKVCALALPGPHSSQLSFRLAQKLAKNLNIEFHKVDFNQSYKSLVADYEKTFGRKKFGLMHENLQARLRGDILMAYSNLNHSLLLNTSNKSELAVGYSTLYGDLCGGLSPIGDLTKGQVVELCQHYNVDHELIPNKIITRPPSAELRPNQKDSDSLPDYKNLDRSVEKLVVKQKPATTKTDRKVLELMYKSEFKRWQAPPILRVSQHAFGRGRRMPIAHKGLD